MDKTWKKSSVEIEGNTLEFIEKGNGETVICLHAIPGSYNDYSGVLDALSTSHRLIAVAWPGYGVDPTPLAKMDLTSPIYFASLFQQFLQKLDIKKAIIIGNSVGGYVAIRAALDKPEIVRGIVLINTAGFTKHNFLSRFFCRLKGTYWGTRILTYPLALAYLRKRNPIVQGMLNRAKSIFFNPRLIELEAKMWLAFLRKDSDLTSLVRDLRVPTLLFWGKKDIILPWWTDGKSCAKAILHAKLVLMNTGHAPHAEAPEKFIQEVQGFLKSIE
jgi:pimeloyl-ACP methyl ester carboxylesterase